MIRYALFQLPEIGMVVAILFLIREWSDLSDRLFALILFLWVLKDVALFPFLWRAYDPKVLSPFHSLVGRTAVARDRLDPEGYVWMGAELWRARVETGYKAVEIGGRVVVMGVIGLTLQVRPDLEKESSLSPVVF